MERRDDRHVDTRANIRSKLRKIFNIDFKLKLELSANSTVRTFSKLSSDFDSYKRFNRRFLKLLYIFNLVVCLLLAPCEAAYLNQWAVEVKGGMVEANRVALNHGFVNLGQIGTLDDFYLFESRRLSKRSTSRSLRGQRELKKDPKILWLKQQRGLVRVKRATGKRRFTDPMWGRMWYLNRKGNNMNVMAAWARGYTGKGVVVAVLDDGLEHNHTDLFPNYDPKASYDVIDDDPDPLPRYSLENDNSHGTRCAGEVAAVANNRKCMVGVAYHAKIGGIRMLDGDVTDAMEASAFSFKPQYIDIYSSSWGPDDNGLLINGPVKLASAAFLKGINEGRNGKGSIYIWASGNGGSYSDFCGCDGYVNSIYTLSVAGVSENGSKPWYLEECASILTTTYSSGDNSKERKIVTTDLRNKCGVHTGTSSSAAMASGICALALQANGNLTWRDMQYIVILTSRTTPFKKPNWVVNGVGRLVSHRFGYGLMDGLAMTLLAEQWVTVPEQHKCDSDYHFFNQTFKNSFESSINSTGCTEQQNEVNHLEHVQAVVWLEYGRRGDLQITLTSPNGTTSKLLGRRKKDLKMGSFKNWTFMSVFYWGEHPRGEWTLNVKNIAKSPFSGIFYGWSLIFYGTQPQPINVSDFNYTSPDKAAYEHNYDYMDEYSGDEDEDDEKQQLSRLKETLNEFINASDQNSFADDDKNVSKEGLKCHIECYNDTCDGPGNGNCTSCRHYQLDSDNSCVRNCPAGTYANSETLMCYDCPEPCSECVLNRIVTPSYQAATFHHIFSNKPDNLLSVNNNYPSPIPHGLMKAADAVESSGEPNSFEAAESRSASRGVELKLLCTSCQPSFLLMVSFSESMCVESCDKGYYPDSSQKQCLACSKGCQMCRRVKECLECHKGYELMGSYCLPDCPRTQYRHKNNSCVPCHQTCLLCNGGGEKNCVVCAKGLVWEKDLCVTSCSVGLYLVTGVNKDANCEMCDPSCKDCVGPLKNQCTSCNRPLILHKQYCLSSCPTGFYEGKGQVCMPCHEHCVNCKGPNHNDCFECKNSRRLYMGDCVLNCPDGTFKVDSDRVTGRRVRRCDKCHITCKSCKSSSMMACLSCHQESLFAYGQCVSHCKESEYKLADKCLRCHRSCQRCNGGGEFHCTACSIDKFMVGSRCVSKCPEGTYELNNRCLFCVSGCASCEGRPPHTCLRCTGGKVDEQGACPFEQPTCSSHHFYDHPNRACIECHSGCLECSGEGANECTSCKEGMALWQSSCHRCCSPDVNDHCCHCHPGSRICYKLVGADAEDVSLSAHEVTTMPAVTLSPNEKEPTIPSSTTCFSPNHTATPSQFKPSQPISSLITTNKGSLVTTHPSNRSQFFIRKEKDPSGHLPSHSNTTTIAIIAGITTAFLITLFLIGAFIIAQAKSHHRLCWSSQYYETVSTKPQHDLSTGRFRKTSCTHVEPVPV